MRLLIVGHGYTGREVARQARAAGIDVLVTTRGTPGPGLIPFAEAGRALAATTHLLVTAPPAEGLGDPFLAAHGAALPGGLVWAGYLSTTGVYGDRAGAWVDEATAPAPTQPRSLRRLAAEEAWRAAAAGRFALDIFRIAGIYGPGRSVIEELLAGTARRVIKPGHAFSRIHVEDIGRAVLAAMARPPAPGTARVLHLADDEPAASADVLAYAARLLGLPLPPAIAYEQAEPAMSPMARSFWAENRRVANAATKAALGLAWAYPSYREGLAAIIRRTAAPPPAPAAPDPAGGRGDDPPP
ncbi:MAG: SDR family NAD(P)-dependent oxidoreductase [Rhodovarius sp.]|nr:SDR family NAD(P)-dependent oxidoreductase [Rhodovarius sp.]MCX7932679.1 SDR family NAD(P)-dependent oxidoreductase [Rhodovarius sp.]MDW8315938.1 SDR family NAD(P)-dependent oxidoreductase [Rhodovarius sp.]